jgi:hypothetical protein
VHFSPRPRERGVCLLLLTHTCSAIVRALPLPSLLIKAAATAEGIRGTMFVTCCLRHMQTYLHPLVL